MNSVKLNPSTLNDAELGMADSHYKEFKGNVVKVSPDLEKMTRGDLVIRKKLRNNS